VKCQRCLQELSEYLDRNLDGGLRQEIEAHLEKCHHCEVVFDTTRRTIEFYCEGEIFELPPRVSARLHEALRRKCGTNA